MALSLAGLMKEGKQNSSPFESNVPQIQQTPQGDSD
jgi:hypothetical protein